MAEQATAQACPSAKSTTKEALVDAGLRIMLEKGYHHTVWARGDRAFCGNLYMQRLEQSSENMFHGTYYQ